MIYLLISKSKKTEHKYNPKKRRERGRVKKNWNRKLIYNRKKMNSQGLAHWKINKFNKPLTGHMKHKLSLSELKSGDITIGPTDT